MKTIKKLVSHLERIHIIGIDISKITINIIGNKIIIKCYLFASYFPFDVDNAPLMLLRRRIRIASGRMWK